jgi:hypothetical protein
MTCAQLPATVERFTRRTFWWLSRARRAPIFHPRGVVVAGSVTFDANPAVSDVDLASRPRVDVVARLSRGAGLPAKLPDLNGIAIRLVDAHGPGAHQDLLFISARVAPILRHVFRPSIGFDRSVSSTVLPYRTSSGRQMLFSADPLPFHTLDDLDNALPFEFSIRAATLMGPWHRVATVRIEHRAPHEQPRFDPWNTGPSLTPAGWLNRLRVPAYRGSRAGSPSGSVRPRRRIGQLTTVGRHHERADAPDRTACA